eukprot:3782691-Amphidinium_carterae.1
MGCQAYGVTTWDVMPSMPNLWNDNLGWDAMDAKHMERQLCISIPRSRMGLLQRGFKRSDVDGGSLFTKGPLAQNFSAFERVSFDVRDVSL